MALNSENSFEDSRTSTDSSLGEQNSIYKTLCHACPEDTESRKRDKKRLIVVSVVCLLFLIAEVVGGILSNSLAIASDAAHLLTDFGAFMVSLTAIWISSKPQTRTMSFGFHRAEILGALISVMSIWLITGILVYMAVQRLLDPSFDLNALIMIYVSVGGVFVNLVMGVILVLYKGGHKGSPGSSGRESLNIQSAVLHVIGDLLQSVGVLIASIVIYFYPHLKVIDPVCTFIFSVIVLITTYFILKDIFLVLMEGFPRHLDFSEVRKVLFSIPGVVKIHNMRMWSLTMNKVALSAHVVVQKGEKQPDVLKNAARIIGRNFNVYELTLQIEETEDPVLKCTVCS